MTVPTATATAAAVAAGEVLAEVLDRHRGAGLVVPGQDDGAERARAELLQRGVPGDGPFGHGGCLIAHAAGDQVKLVTPGIVVVVLPCERVSW